MDLLLCQRPHGERPTNPRKKWRILPISIECHRINKCCDISFPPRPRKSWFKLPPSNILLRFGRQWQRCSPLKQSRDIFGLRFLELLPDTFSESAK
jgi:hypothetical protein